MIYNILKEIKDSLVSYEAFYKMISNRAISYYKNKQELENFIVFGALYLDSRGNVWKLQKKINVVDDVMTKFDVEKINLYIGG